MKSVVVIALVAGIIISGVAGLFIGINYDQPDKDQFIPEKEIFEERPSVLETSEALLKFESTDEIREFLSKSYANQYSGSLREGRAIEGDFVVSQEPIPMPRPTAPPMLEERAEFDYSNSGAGADYSTTNIQVAGVDEPDYIKNDGKYMYIVSQNTLSIIDAYPAKDAKLLVKIALDIPSQDLQNMFLNGDNLVIFYYGSGENYEIPEFDFAPRPIYVSKTFATILDVSDRTNPQKVTTFEIDGNYQDSRMIDDIVYLVTTNYADYIHPIIPRVMAESQVIVPDVFYFPNPEQSYNFNTVSAIDVSGKLVNSETFLMGSSNTIYVSEENLYITYQKYVPPQVYDDIKKDRFFSVVIPLLPQSIQNKIKEVQNNTEIDSYQKWQQVSIILQDYYNNLSKQEKERLFSEIQKALDDFDDKMQLDSQRTSIHKISLDEGGFSYVANAEVPGYLLNQFSMDESKGKFRIATTSESYSRTRTTMSNNVFVLDENLKIIGSLDKIAPDERIYSSRFIDDKLYLVTFKRVDPFFVIDLSSNTPKILGELKIPGFSNYLHPLDKDHIIGIGRDTIEDKDFVRTKGVKLALFDISDFKNPKERDSIVIGSSSTDSEILYNHKAFFLDAKRNIMSVPIKGYLEDQEMAKRPYSEDGRWNGFFVYHVDRNGFDEMGTITHYKDTYPSVYMQSRSFYINDVLYTIMDGSIKMNDINDLSEIKTIKLAQTGDIIRYPEPFE